LTATSARFLQNSCVEVAMQLAHTHTDAAAPHHVRDDLVAGGLASQVAGLVMAIVMMLVYAVFLGTSPLFPVQVIGSLFTGDAALHGFHLPSLLAGLVFHQLGPCLVWGLAFAGVVHALDLRSAVGLALGGLAIGVASQVIDVDVLAAPVWRAAQGHDIWSAHVPEFWSWAAHLVFGIALASFGWIRPKIGA
jgi:hypothetical protein